MIHCTLRTLVLALLLAAVVQPPSAAADPEKPAVVIVLDDRFEAMKLTFKDRVSFAVLGGSVPKWVFAREFKDDRETAGFILRVTHARPIPVPKSQKFVGGTKSWNDVAVRYPFRLTYRDAGKGPEQPIMKGEIRGEASPLKVKEVQVVTMKYELRIVTLNELATEAARKILTGAGLHRELMANLMPLIATPDRKGSLIGGIQHTVRRGKEGTMVVVPMKNRLPVRVTGELRSSWTEERGKFDLKPGEARNVQFTVAMPPAKVQSTVALETVRLEPPAARKER